MTMKHYGCAPSDLAPDGFDCTPCCKKLTLAVKALEEIVAVRACSNCNSCGNCGSGVWDAKDPAKGALALLNGTGGQDAKKET